jgi:hypothetical protein
MRLRNVKPSLRITAFTGKAFLMGEERQTAMSREERLAARLRENLRRRKAQARAMNQDESPDSAHTLPKAEPNG